MMSTARWKRTSTACPVSGIPRTIVKERMRESAPAYDRLLALIDDFAGIRVAVFGDFLADEFIYGQIARVSREAPVLILDYDSTEIVPGGAGNAANNVAALGGTPSAIGVAGRRRNGPAPARGARARREPSRDRAATRLSNADQDTHPGRRRPFGEAAGRTDRPGRAPRAHRRRSARDRGEARLGRGALRRAARVRLRHGPRHACGRSPGQPALCGSRPAGARARRFALRAAPVPRDDDLHAERVRSRAAVRHHVSATTCARSRRPDGSCCRGRGSQAVLITRGSRGMALFEPDRADRAHSDLRIGSDRRRHRRRRHRHRHDDARARGGRHVQRGGAPGQLRRRSSS